MPNWTSGNIGASSPIMNEAHSKLGWFVDRRKDRGDGARVEEGQIAVGNLPEKLDAPVPRGQFPQCLLLITLTENLQCATRPAQTEGADDEIDPFSGGVATLISPQEGAFTLRGDLREERIAGRRFAPASDHDPRNARSRSDGLRDHDGWNMQ